MSLIKFNTQLYKIGDWTILCLPKVESAKLPSRGITMVKGSIDKIDFQAALEPDGKGSHWLRVDQIIGNKNTHNVKVEMESVKDWPEPYVPTDLKKALNNEPKIQKLWREITPMARWDWIRWIKATKNEGTRKHRIDVAFSKLKSGMKRPCCFNRAACCEPYVSKNGVLIAAE